MREESIAAFKAQSQVAVSKEAAAPVPLRTINEIIGDLSKPIPDRLIQHRDQGGKDLSYITWRTAVRFLDWIAPRWSFEIRSVTWAGSICTLVGRLTLQTLEGPVFREASASKDATKGSGYGGVSESLEARCLKRAAAKFSLAIALYDDEDND